MQNNPSILVLNAGSSSLKFSLYQLRDQTETVKGLAERLGEAEPVLRLTRPEAPLLPLPAGADHTAALELLHQVLEALISPAELVAIGHRVVHGGEQFQQTTRLSAEVIATLRTLIPLALLHNPANLAGIEAAFRAWPDLPQFAVFDTAFH